MGSLTQSIRSITGTDADAIRSRERLDVLLLAAKAKTQQYRQEINEGFINPSIVDGFQIRGIRVLRFTEQYHVACRADFNRQVSEHLRTSIKTLLQVDARDVAEKESVQACIHHLILKALEDFIGFNTAGESERKTCLIVPEKNSLVRADIACWRYNVTQEELVGQSDCAVAYLVCRSVVDHRKVTSDDLINFAAQACTNVQAIQPYIDELIRVWTKLIDARSDC